MNKMRMYRVFIPGYGAIEWSSNKRAPVDSNPSSFIFSRISWVARVFYLYLNICGNSSEIPDWWVNFISIVILISSYFLYN